MGRGTNGIVYRVRDTRTGNTIVMKRLDKSEQERRSIVNEVEILQSFQDKCHPNLLCYVDSFEDLNYYYILTEYLGGYVTLEELIDSVQRKDRSLSTQQMIGLVNSLQQGVHQLFEHGISHRDLKPGNIMVKLTGSSVETKIIDFGSACREPCVTWHQVGTPIYLPPELLTDQFIDQEQTILFGEQ